MVSLWQLPEPITDSKQVPALQQSQLNHRNNIENPLSSLHSPPPLHNHLQRPSFETSTTKPQAKITRGQVVCNRG